MTPEQRLIADAERIVAELTSDTEALEQLPRRLDVRCAYCGELDCTDRWQHARDNAANETTWRLRRVQG